MSKVSASSADTSGSEENGSRGTETRSPELTSGGAMKQANTAEFRGFSYRSRGHPQRKRAKKDPNAPVKPLSAYLLFLLDKQEEIRRNSRDVLSVAETTKRVGQAWRTLSSEDRKIYEEQADKAKLQHAAEMEEYKKTDDYRNFLALAADSNSETDVAPRKSDKRSRVQRDRDTPSTVNSSTSNRRGKKHASGDSESVIISRKRKTEEVDTGVEDLLGMPPAKVHSVAAGSLQEFHIPVWTDEFMQWNTKRERELKHVKKAADELDIDISGLISQSEQTQRNADSVNALKSKVEDTKKAKREALKIILEGMSGIALPSGLEMDNTNAEEYMTELETVVRKSPARHSSLLMKVMELAKKLQPLAVYV
ncbi:high mobility group protein 20A-like [Paramacrobiotus metropolitanus]|uniref:high mobility group protein 20A-like n=1 Tax=Paramacrobiotus metropolitanus TaxID=2943436 RepID=UPI00244580B5|nr:high mobility group protein 20A-like [Paramacrobiotus metropolitanus]